MILRKVNLWIKQHICSYSLTFYYLLHKYNIPPSSLTGDLEKFVSTYALTNVSLYYYSRIKSHSLPRARGIPPSETWGNPNYLSANNGQTQFVSYSGTRCRSSEECAELAWYVSTLRKHFNFQKDPLGTCRYFGVIKRFFFNHGRVIWYNIVYIRKLVT